MSSSEQSPIDKALEIGENEDSICLLCGKQMSIKYAEYSDYYECDCEKARHNRNIINQIEELKNELYENEFEIVQKSHLVKINVDFLKF